MVRKAVEEYVMLRDMWYQVSFGPLRHSYKSKQERAILAKAIVESEALLDCTDLPDLEEYLGNPESLNAIKFRLRFRKPLSRPISTLINETDLPWD